MGPRSADGAVGDSGNSCILQSRLLEPGFVYIVSASPCKGEYLCINFYRMIIFFFKLVLSIK